MNSSEDEMDGVSSAVEKKEIGFAFQSISNVGIAGITAVDVLAGGAENGSTKEFGRSDGIMLSKLSQEEVVFMSGAVMNPEPEAERPAW